jgi:aldose 1-epimerase
MLELRQDIVTVEKIFYGNVNGGGVYCFILRNAAVEIMITNLGCAIISIIAPDKAGVKKNIVAGYEGIEEYARNPDYLGCVLGRYANRIAGGSVKLDGREVKLTLTNKENHLHGGLHGFHRQVWDIATVIRNENEAGIVFEYHSKDGEEGYPGNLHVTVTYLLTLDNRLRINYRASTDKPTIVNLSNHSYFNLTGFDNPDILDHVLQINATCYTEKNSNNIPTGKLLPVAGTPLDFSEPKPIGKEISKFPFDDGFDHNYALNGNGKEVALAAILTEPGTGRMLRVFTDQPGLQLYTANAWDGRTFGRQHKPYLRHGAVALETQAFPDSPNHANFPCTILRPGDVFEKCTIYEFGVM